MEFSVGVLIVITLCILLTGIGKGGIVGASCVTIPVLAMCMGGQESVGFLLPISLAASFLSAIRNRTDVNWAALMKSLPWAILGIGIGGYVGMVLREEKESFFILLALVIIVGCTITIIQHLKHSAFRDPFGISYMFFGILAGFAAMIGNATGPMISTLFLLQRFPKKQIVDTHVWFCFITDVIKVPIHVFCWKTITFDSFVLDLYMAPAMVIGVFIGFWLIRVLNEKIYKNTVITLSCISALVLLLQSIFKLV